MPFGKCYALVRLSAYGFFDSLTQSVGKLEIHLGRNGDDVFRGVEDITVGNGLFHCIGVKRFPKLREVGASVELAESSENFIAWRGGEADNEVFLLRTASDKPSVFIEYVLQFIECRKHFLMHIVGVGAVHLVDEKSHTLIGKTLSGALDSFFQLPKFLDVDHDDAAFVAQRGYECILIRCLDEHRLVDVHVEHHGVELVAKLQTVNDQKNLVVDPLAVVAQVFEL